MTPDVTILGAGHQGLAMAAHLGSCGISCGIWNRSERHISMLKERGRISCTGAIIGDIPVAKASTDIREVMSDLLLIATPSTAHADIARMLAPYLNKTSVVVLNPGRTFGAASFANILKESGCTILPPIAETQTIVYTCRRDESTGVHIFALKEDVPIACVVPDDTGQLVKRLPDCLAGYFKEAVSTVETSFGNVGMVLHCAPMLMNIGWVESDATSFRYYYDGISPTIAGYLEKIDSERVAVSKALGHEVESVAEWLRRTYSACGDSLYEVLQSNIYYRDIKAPETVNHRYLYEDIPNGLVPLESTAHALGIETPATTAAVSFASEVLGCDFRAVGRHYDDAASYLDVVRRDPAEDDGGVS